MKLRLFLQIISVFLGARIAFSILYFLMGWSITIQGKAIPIWLGILGIAVDGILVYWACKLLKKVK